MVAMCSGLFPVGWKTEKTPSVNKHFFLSATFNYVQFNHEQNAVLLIQSLQVFNKNGKLFDLQIFKAWKICKL